MNPVIKKLQYKDQEKILIVNAPPEFGPICSAFPCEIAEEIGGRYGFILFFAVTRAEAVTKIDAVLDALVDDGYM